MNPTLADRYHDLAEAMNARGSMELAVPFYRQAVALFLPAITPVCGFPDSRRRIRRIAPLRITIERQHPERHWITRMNCNRKTECRWKPRGNIVPALSTIAAAENTVMVLLIQQITL